MMTMMARCAFALCLLVLGSGVSSAQAQPRTIDVVASRYAFSPSEVTVKKGEAVVFRIKSVDVRHGLRFRELNLDCRIKKGDTGVMSFTPTKAGDFVGHCSVFCGSGHGTMTMTLHVVE